ncbi:MAG: inorganic diphosphatase [Rickettsiales bacterium]
MGIDKVGPGKNAPDEVNVVIEIPMNAGPIKYEFDKDTGMITVDRFMPTSMSYPCNYGFIPGTLSGDGDPADVLVYSSHQIVPGAVIRVKPVGVLMTEDESGMDEKILAVPANKIDVFFTEVNSYKDLPPMLLKKIEHFFENYKKLEVGKWVKISGWKDASEAKEIIKVAISNAKK